MNRRFQLAKLLIELNKEIIETELLKVIAFVPTVMASQLPLNDFWMQSARLLLQKHISKTR